MKKEVIVHQNPKAPISEIFRTLRTNMQFMNVKGQLKTILITSTLPEEGKSWISANLATTFAQAGKRVILIDGDMRKGRQYAIFNVAPKPGLSNYLSGIDIENEEVENLNQYIQETEVENLYVMAAGNVPPNPSELLIAPQMVNLLEQLKEIFDIVIIDGTPSQLVTDSLILTRLVDSTLIVTASKETKKEDLKRVINNIQNVGGKIAGVVINKMPMSVKKYDQSYYYGSTTTKNIKTSKNKMKKNENKLIYNRTSNILKNNVSQSTQINKIENNTEPKKTIENNKATPKTLNRDIKIENKEEISIEKTNDILQQINKYLDEEKKKLK